MKIIVCEDNAGDRRVLCSLIDKYMTEIGCSFEIVTYEKGEALINDLNNLKTSGAVIAFLDIYMPGINGIETARKVREVIRDIIIILTTTSLDHGLDGYSIKALGYLVKPVKYPELSDTLNSFTAMFADSLRFIEVLSDRLTARVLLKDITHVEVFKNDCLIHTPSKTIKCRYTLDEMGRRLNGGAFLRTHRSYIVNMRYIKCIMENDFLLTNGTLVPIRRNDRPAVKQSYMDYAFALARGQS
jgi:DNA-binding LytR/AlgR family response regulator